MSGGEDKEGFLARWSQRKQEAKQPEPRPDEPVTEAEAEIPPAPIAEAEADAAPAFDLSSLPKLEEMTGATDITGFLRKGVPEHLRNAALRKSWALDPAIRNYVNPALEYAYDWNTPGGAPGVSEIGAGMDVRRMVSQIMGDGSAVEPPAAADPATEPAADPALSAEHRTSPEPEPEPPTEALRLTEAGVSVAQEAADTDEGGGPEIHRTALVDDDDPAASQQPVRRHGSAKPFD